MVPASVLGGVALLLIIAGLITGWSLAVPLRGGRHSCAVDDLDGPATRWRLRV